MHLAEDFDEDLVRDCVKNEFFLKSYKFISQVLQNNWNYSDCNSHPFYDFCSFEAQRFENEVTELEFQYILYHMQVGCALEELQREGRIVKVGNKYYANSCDSSNR